MSAKSKDRNRIRRLAMKKAKRERNAVTYAERIAAGRNTLTKRSKIAAKKGKGKKIRAIKHASRCDNRGCLRCGPLVENDPWFATPGSCLYGKRWSSPKHRRDDQ